MNWSADPWNLWTGRCSMSARNRALVTPRSKPGNRTASDPTDWPARSMIPIARSSYRWRNSRLASIRKHTNRYWMRHLIHDRRGDSPAASRWRRQFPCLIVPDQYQDPLLPLSEMPGIPPQGIMSCATDADNVETANSDFFESHPGKSRLRLVAKAMLCHSFFRPIGSYLVALFLAPGESASP